MNPLSILGIFLALTPAAPAAVLGAPNFESAAAEAVPILQEYLRIDTTNPLGRERAAAEYFQRLFESEGIESRVYDLGDGRANVLARLPGRVAKRPILLLN